MEDIATDTAPEVPSGFLYCREFIGPDDEQRLLELVDQLDFRELVMRGQIARRTVRLFGHDYDYETGQLLPGDPLPGGLGWLREGCAELAGLAPEALVQALVSRYPAGAGIGWHRDAPMFGSKVIGVSLLSVCRMRFQRRAEEGIRLSYAVELVPRSAYVLAGSARWAWQHSIPPTKALRYSITFRTLRER
jgi:alkylated DNA repair protein (DNA oxidative demethylase)